VSPDIGRTAGGELVIIEGTLFETGTEVFFGSSQSPDVVVYSEYIIHARTPMHKAGMVDIQLRSSTGETVVVPDGFLFRDKLAIDAIEPNHGPAAGGTPFTVHGEGFAHNTHVLLDGRLAIDITVVDSKTIHAIAPPGEVGPADIIVSTAWASNHKDDAYRYEQAPVVSSFSPHSGPTNSPTSLLFEGLGLPQSAQVVVGGIPATVTGGDGNTKLVVSVGGDAAGTVDIEIITEGGSIVLAGAFTFVAPGQVGTTPTLLNVFPKTGSASGGTSVTLTATGFDDGALTILFGDAAATVVSANPAEHRIDVITPPGSDTVSVTLTAGGISDTLTDAFVFTQAPSIASVHPTMGSMDGGETVSIYGSYLADAEEVFVGALPATIKKATDNTLTIRTPPGSPGSATVRVVTPEGEVSLIEGYTYLPEGGPQVYAILPNYGAIAGNTYLQVLGAGFGVGGEIHLGDKPASQVVRHSTTQLTARAPKADSAGVVDVRVTMDGKTRTLVDAYSYYDPKSPYGGAWGPTIDGTVNITVLDVFDTSAIPGAFVMLGNENNPQFKGWTDNRGQITFSAPEIIGRQMVTAAKESYTTYSVVEYDAENVTVHLIPFNPPAPPGGGGGGPKQLPFGHITGKVDGLGKYVVVPPQSCTFMAANGLAGSEGSVNCLPCSIDADCGGNGALCVEIANDGTYCSSPCSSDANCPEGYVCGSGTNAGDKTPQCIPDPGEKAAYCQTTSARLWESPPTPHIPALPEDDGSRAWTDLDGSYWMKTRLGELAIVCIGGVVRDSIDKVASFEPLAMGVVRHVNPIPDVEVSNIDVLLDIPLSKWVPIRLDGSPTQYVDPFTNAVIPTAVSVQTALDFGGEGYWEMAALSGSGVQDFTLTHQPDDLSGQLDGVTYSFFAQATGGATAVSATQSYKVKVLHVDRVFQRSNGVWKAIPSGIPKNVHALWGASSADLWAVGHAGLIAHGNGANWFQQYSPSKLDLRGIWGTAPDHVVVVGDEGTIIRFDGAVWTQVDTPTDRDLHAVWGTAPDNMFAVGDQVVLHRDHLGWQEIPGPPTTLRAVWGPDPLEFWAVGDDGMLWRYDGVWQSTPLATNGVVLRALHGTDAQHAWVAGDLGTLFELSPNDSWTQHDMPTTEHINAVYASTTGTVHAVGNRGTLLHYDGLGWTAETAPKYGGDLLAVWGFDDPASDGIAAGTQVVTLGPMLSFPMIDEPTVNGPGGSGAFTYRVNWTVAPSTSPTFNFIEMMAGQQFPLWWTVVEADVMDVHFPNLPLIQGLYPLPPGSSIMLVVNRILKPGSTADNFDFWDTYDQSSWKSWSQNSRSFVPF
jgi:hypothetical protein